MDSGPEVIGDDAERARVRRQARAVYLKSFLAAVVLTAVAFIL
jgi:hypothetical protein